MERDLVAALIVSAVCTLGATAETPFLAPIFSDHMVFAADRPVRIFGSGEGTVAVRFGGAERTVVARDGRWIAEFPPEKAGGPYELEVMLGDEVRTIRDVMFGEVILVAGQSNVKFRLEEDSFPRADRTDDGRLRYHAVRDGWVAASNRVSEGWCISASNAVDKWSSLGYHLGNSRVVESGAAVGIVECSRGASTIQSWLPAEIADRPEFNLPPGGRLHGDHTWERYAGWNAHHGTLYRQMFESLVPFSFSAVVWYQGESNTGHLEGVVYGGLLAQLIGRWRSDLKDPGLPFVVVQIADYCRRDDEDWRLVQRAQAEIGRHVSGAFAVRSSDVCAKDSIHPPEKLALARRISRCLSGIGK